MNLSEATLSLEQDPLFEPLPNWTAVTMNQRSPKTTSDLAPFAVYQYLYLLKPSPHLPLPLPGSSQALGRLDIRWRSANGGGKLITSMLGRKVPSNPMDSTPNHNLSNPSHPLIHSGLTFDLRVLPLSPTPIHLNQSFEVRFHLSIRGGKAVQERRLRLAAQFYQHVEEEEQVELGERMEDAITRLPSPTKVNTRPEKDHGRLDIQSSNCVIKVGGSLVELEAVILLNEAGTRALVNQSDLSSPGSSVATVTFAARFLPIATGLLRVGGIRILLLSDNDESTGVAYSQRSDAITVVELDSFVEIFVESG
jgi:hypothetical protein